MAGKFVNITLKTFVNYAVFVGLVVIICVKGCPVEEREALLNFRASLNDSNAHLKSWEGVECCRWRGVNCSYGEAKHVVTLDLHGFELSTLIHGQMDSSLFQLRQLRYLDLSLNSFEYIHIPQSLGMLRNLTYLNMSYAGFEGEVPSELGNLSSLRYLDLSSHYLYSSSSNSLRYTDYSLKSSGLEWVRSMSSLIYLSLDGINLSKISTESWGKAIGSLSKLTHLGLSECSLSGSIPLALHSLSSLAFLDLRGNNFRGHLPSWLGNMSSVTSLDLSSNSFIGHLPSWLGNMSSMTLLDLSSNSFTGEIPSSLGNNIHTLQHLSLGENQLQSIPSSLGNLSALQSLDLWGNQLQSIPSSLGNLSALQSLDLWGNQLQSIPSSLGNLSALQSLDLWGNKLNNNIASCLTSLPSSLQSLSLSSNNMVGTISEAFFDNFAALTDLDLSHGGKLSVDMSSTWIPQVQLQGLNLKSCKISGPFPAWLSTQLNIKSLDLSSCDLIRDIPSWVQDLLLEELLLSNNHLSGHIPPGLCVQFLDISNNGINGNIPASLATCQ